MVQTSNWYNRSGQRVVVEEISYTDSSGNTKLTTATGEVHDNGMNLDVTGAFDVDVTTTVDINAGTTYTITAGGELELNCVALDINGTGAYTNNCTTHTTVATGASAETATTITKTTGANDDITLVATTATVIISDATATGVLKGTTAGRLIMRGTIADISTAEVITFLAPFAGNIVAVTTVLEGAISGTDATITAKDKSGNSMGTITVAQSGSAALDVDTLAPASNQDVAINDPFTVETDGLSTGTQRLVVTVVLALT